MQGKLSGEKYSLGMVAVPIGDMARDVFGKIREKSVGRGLRYAAINLSKLLRVAKSGLDEEAVLRVSGIKLRVDGDPPMENLELSGRWSQSIIDTQAYLGIVALKGVATAPIAARVVHKEVGRRPFCARCTSQGYLHFQIGRGGSGLHKLHNLLVMLNRRGVLESTLDFPAIEEDVSSDGDND
jgi:hypothetical protein